MDLIIGIGIGIVSAAALAVMWRTADRLEREMQSREPAGKETTLQSATDDQ